MAELGRRDLSDALAALASPAEPAAAGVASALSAAAAAGLVELAAGLAAKKLVDGNPRASDGAADRMRGLGRQAGKLRERLLAAGDEDVRTYGQVFKANQGRERARALDRASDPPLAIAEGAA